MGLFTLTRVTLFIVQINTCFVKFLNQIIITCHIILLVKSFLEEGHMAAQWHFSSQQVAATQGPTHFPPPTLLPFLNGFQHLID